MQKIQTKSKNVGEEPRGKVEMIFVLDIGGTFTKYAYYDKGVLSGCGKWQTTHDVDILLTNIEKVATIPFAAIGISSGGFWTIDGKAIGYQTIDSTADGNFVDKLRQKYHCPVYIENDARCAVLCEKEYGEGIENSVFIALGSSLGCGVMINGKLFRGNNNQGASMFAMPELFNGKVYHSDKYANSLYMSSLYSKKCRGNFYEVEKRAVEGDERAVKILELYIQSVAIKAYYSSLMFAPEIIYFGGAISKSDYLFGGIQDKFEQFCQMDKTRIYPRLEQSKFGSNANLLGAGLLIDKADKYHL